MTETVPTGAAIADAKTPGDFLAAVDALQVEHAASRPAKPDPDTVASPAITTIPGKTPDHAPLQRDPVHHRMLFSDGEESRQTMKNLMCREYPRSDLGNSQRYITRFGRDFLYCHSFRSWYHYDGCRWARDESRSAVEYAKEAVMRIADEAGLKDFGTDQEATFKWAAASQASSKITSMILLAQSSLAITPDQFDPDPDLLNFPDGTLNLKDLTIQPATRADHITKVCGCHYDPAATAPIWEKFLHRIMGGNQDLISFLQRAVGYSLSGNTGERAFFLCHGAGANGKSTFLNTLLSIMGDYGHTVEPDTYCVSRSDAVRNDLAGLKGVRFAVSTESRKGKRLDESIVKQLTGGGDKIRARFLFQEYFEFQPECKIWWAFNTTPRITDSTESIWSRVRMIPFAVTIPEAERDIHLPAKLQRETPGILNWMIAGYKEYHRIGLAEPAEVRAATAEYRENEDTFADFISQMCTVDPGVSCEATSLYQAYTKWIAWEAPEEKPKSQRGFGFEMGDRGFKRDRDSATKRKIYTGIRPKSGGF